ncbi:DUF4397 domain-containing protein [Streptacidiphilus cavernicola]|uniref:DUF4397 domain-containing protein n=1 Tax=Streptacidiphilus cavernicola TaxID=3342716 RepID=A0ABV6VPR0_9ACTN
MTLRLRRPAAVLLAAALGSAALVAPAAAATPAASNAWTGGWLRLAHFSPGTPPVDVYLYPFGGSRAALVLKHVAYGDASPYESVATGQYTVAMRLAGASSTQPPVISSTVDVVRGKAYTVAGLGPTKALQLQTLPDQLSAPSGEAGVRVIQASLTQPSVSVDVAGLDQSSLRFPTSTPYRTVPAGSTTVKVSTAAASTSRTVELAGRSTHTLVVLSSAAAAPQVIDLTDSAGPSTQPQGGVAAGLGGASSTGSSLAATAGWAAALLAGAAVAFLAARRLRRR